MEEVIRMSKPIPKSILSLDIGSKRIGLAGCDPLGITVKTLQAIKRKGLKEDLKIFQIHCRERSVKGLVIGIPLDQSGNMTPQAERCKQYGLRIAKELGLPIAWVNEHSSTWEAENIYKLKGDRTGMLDSAAALLLLKQWLSDGPELKPVDLASH